MSFSEKLVSTATNFVDSLGLGPDAKKFVEKQMGPLLEKVESKIAGVPTLPEMEALWYEVYKRKNAYDNNHKKLFVAESKYNGLKGTDREEEAKTDLLATRAEEKKLKEEYEVALKAATDAQEKVLKARKG